MRLEEETGDARFVDYPLRGSEEAQDRRAEKAYLHIRKMLLRHLQRWERRLGHYEERAEREGAASR